MFYSVEELAVMPWDKWKKFTIEEHKILCEKLGLNWYLHVENNPNYDCYRFYPKSSCSMLSVAKIAKLLRKHALYKDTPAVKKVAPEFQIVNCVEECISVLKLTRIREKKIFVAFLYPNIKGNIKAVIQLNGGKEKGKEGFFYCWHSHLGLWEGKLKGEFTNEVGKPKFVSFKNGNFPVPLHHIFADLHMHSDPAYYID